MSQTIYTLSCEDAIAFLSEAAWGFAEVNEKGEFIWVNQAYANVLNAPPDLILGTNFRTWTHPDDVVIDSKLAARVITGEINYYTLAKRYIQRGSTKAVPRLIWGMLSVQGKYSQSGEFLGFRCQFRPYNDTPKALDYIAKATILTQWTIANWKTIVTILAVSSTLVFGGSGALFDLLKRAKDTVDSVDSVLDSSSSGASQAPP